MVRIAVLSCRTWCGLTLYTLVARPSCLARVSGLAGLARVSGVSRPTSVSGLARLARVSGVSRAARVSGLACTSGLSNLSLRPRWSWDRRRRGVVTPSNKQH